MVATGGHCASAEPNSSSSPTSAQLSKRQRARLCQDRLVHKLLERCEDLEHKLELAQGDRMAAIAPSLPYVASGAQPPHDVALRRNVASHASDSALAGKTIMELNGQDLRRVQRGRTPSTALDSGTANADQAVAAVDLLPPRPPGILLQQGGPGLWCERDICHLRAQHRKLALRVGSLQHSLTSTRTDIIAEAVQCMADPTARAREETKHAIAEIGALSHAAAADAARAALGDLGDLAGTVGEKVFGKLILYANDRIDERIARLLDEKLASVLSPVAGDLAAPIKNSDTKIPPDEALLKKTPKHPNRNSQRT